METAYSRHRHWEGVMGHVWLTFFYDYELQDSNKYSSDAADMYESGK
jgi:hypothetical protein